MGAPGSLNPDQKLTNKMPERGRAEGEGRGEAGHGGGLGEQKEGGNPKVESGGTGANTAEGGGRGERGPKETLARDPTPGVWGAPR